MGILHCLLYDYSAIQVLVQNTYRCFDILYMTYKKNLSVNNNYIDNDPRFENNKFKLNIIAYNL
jgi:hypothetical protein